MIPDPRAGWVSPRQLARETDKGTDRENGRRISSVNPSIIRLSSQQDCISLALHAPWRDATCVSEAFCPNIQPRAHARLIGLTNHPSTGRPLTDDIRLPFYVLAKRERWENNVSFEPRVGRVSTISITATRASATQRRVTTCCRSITYCPARSMLTHFLSNFEEIRDAHRPSSTVSFTMRAKLKKGACITAR